MAAFDHSPIAHHGAALPAHHQSALCCNAPRWIRMPWNALRPHAHRLRRSGTLRAMTYCVGLLVDTGLVMLSDSRTNAGVDQINTFRKMATFQRKKDRVLVLMSAGNLAITQAVVNLLHEVPEEGERLPRIYRAANMFNAARVVGEVAARDLRARRPAPEGPRPRLQRHLHPGGTDQGRGTAALSRLLGGQLHRVVHRHALLPDRRIEVRQTHHRPG